MHIEDLTEVLLQNTSVCLDNYLTNEVVNSIINVRNFFSIEKN